MGKKAIFGIVILIIIVALVVGAFYLINTTPGGALGVILGGTNVGQNFMSNEEKQLAIECTDSGCLFEKFELGCEKSYGDVQLDEQEMLVYLEVAGEKENGQCILNARLLDANGTASYAIGLEATCLVAPEEVEAIQENFNLNEMNCEGPLYEAAKLAQ